MKKKILLCLICGVMLLGITGCGNESESSNLKESNNNSTNTDDGAEEIICNQKEVATVINKDGKTTKLDTPVEQNFEAVFVFKDGKISEIKTTVTYEYDSDEISEEDIEKQDKSTIRGIEYTSAKEDISHKKNKSVITVTLDYNKLSESEKEETNMEGVTLEELLNKKNESTRQYCYNPKDKEKVTTPKKLEGTYTEIKEEEWNLQTVFIFDEDKVTTYDVDSDGTKEHEEVLDYEYKNGKLTINHPAHDGYHEMVYEYVVKSGYKGYDTVFLYGDYNEVYRLEHTN